MTFWKHAESLELPSQIDETISNNCVYIRKNIQEIEREGTTIFEYDEAVLTLEEYRTYQLVTSLSSLITYNHDTQIIDDYTLQLIEEGIL